MQSRCFAEDSVRFLRGPHTWCEHPFAYCRRATVWIVSRAVLVNTGLENWKWQSTAAKKAAGLALQYQPNIVAETKPDKSPVTQADRECEQMIARMLSEAFPDDGILGEEGARAESRSGRRWIIDPIDGTRDYVRGNPLWANLIALEADGDVVVGVVNLPVLGKLYIASRGGGAYCNGSRRFTLRPKHPSRNLFYA